MAKILKCDDCGSIIQVLVEDDGDTCDTHMLSIPVQTEGEKSPNVEAGAEQYAKSFKPGDVAEVTFTVNSTDDVKACAFCNLHGLWASE